MGRRRYATDPWGRRSARWDFTERGRDPEPDVRPPCPSCNRRGRHAAGCEVVKANRKPSESA